MFPCDLTRAAAALLAEARAAQLFIATAESCTGGLVAAVLTELPGSSDVVDRGFVTYSNDAKIEMLGVRPELLAEHGAVSREVVQAMAEGALVHSCATLSIAVTGVAGPAGGTAAKPVGLIHLAAARVGHATRHREHRFGAIGRDGVRRAAVAAAIELLREMAAASAT